MALTAGFKKFLGLIVVVAVVGGGIAYYKHMPRHVDDAVTTPVDTTASEAPAPVASTPEPSVRPDQTETQEAPAQPATKPDASANRGLSAVLNAGKK